MYNIFNVRRDEWEIGRLNLRDAATERRTTIPYREEISHSAMSGSFSFVNQIYKMKEIKEFKNIPLNQIFTWDGPLEVAEYEFWISGEEDPDLDNPELKIDGILGNTLDYPYDGDFPLEYATNYYWRVVPKDINGNYGLQSSYSSVYQFTTSAFAELVGPYLEVLLKR